jgi:hypothetical protein
MNVSTLALNIISGVIVVQYYLSVMLSLQSGGWAQFLLMPSQINFVLFFCTLMSIFMMIGYFAKCLIEKSKIKKLRNISALEFINYTAGTFGIKKYIKHTIRPAVYGLLLILIVQVVRSIYVEGTVAGAFFSSLGRGSGQFTELSDLHLFIDVAASLTALVTAFVGLHIAYYISESRTVSQLFSRLPISMTILLIGSAPLLFKFSRLSGAAFLISAAVLLSLSKKNSIKAIVVPLFFVIGLYMCVIGYSHRAIAPMGSGSFILTMMQPRLDEITDLFTGEQASSFTSLAALNFLDALGPASISIHFNGLSEYGVLPGLAWLLAILQPLPSAFVPIDMRPGISLSTWLGTIGSTGLTTPALAELWYLLGYWSLAMGLIFGFCIRVADSFLQESRRLSSLIVALMIVSVVIAGHSGLRAFSRPFVLSLLCIFLSGRVFILGHLRIDLRA